MNKSITCPFCFETFDSRTVFFSCENGRCAGKGEDPVYATARGLLSSGPKGKSFQKKNLSFSEKFSREVLKANCDSCGKETTIRICPKCHFKLSPDAGKVDDYIIAIIGGRNAGKGHYIATLINRLQNEVGSHFNSSIRFLDDETRFRYRNDYEKPLYEQKILLSPTQSASVDGKVKLPMVFRITMDDGKKNKACTLSFFDSAGEDMNSLDVLSTEARYICFAAGVIFILDPLQIDAVRQMMPDEKLPPRDTSVEPVFIVERLRDLYERQYQLKPTDKIKTPVAFALSKTDMLLPLIDPGTALGRPGGHFGKFNVPDAQSVDTEISNYLQTWIGHNFTNQVATGFSSSHYFGVSSLGAAPTANGQLKSISPTRVEDPLLWILYELGWIEGNKRK